MDYGLLPPEVNSGRMYAGLGSASMVTAAVAYEALAVELGVASGSFDGVVSALATGSWLGPSSMAMLTTALPFIEWLATEAAKAQVTAIAAGQAASAWEAARAAVIPPPVIAENRVRLATLVATNFLGVNSPAIAATEAEYDEFWAQDASTMYGFASEATTISSSLVPFIPPATVTNPAGPAAGVAASTGEAAGQASTNVGQATAQMASMPTGMSSVAEVLSSGTSVMGTVPQMLHSLASPMTSVASQAGSFQSMLGPLLSMVNPGMFSGLSSGIGSGIGSTVSTLGSFSSAPTGVSGVTAMMGRAETLPTTKLSVPQSWVSTTQTESALVTPLTASPANGASEAAVQSQPILPPAGGAGVPQQGAGNLSGYPAPTGSLGLREGEGRPSSLPKPLRFVPKQVG